MKVEKSNMIFSEANIEDGDLIKEKAEEVFKTQISNIQIIGVKIISNWVENSEWVFTDSTKTKKKLKMAKSINVQIKARRKSGQSFLALFTYRTTFDEVQN